MKSVIEKSGIHRRDLIGLILTGVGVVGLVLYFLDVI